jgi:hypothetical protein
MNRQKLTSAIPWLIAILALVTNFIPRQPVQPQTTIALYPGEEYAFNVACLQSPIETPTPDDNTATAEPTNTNTPEPVNTNTPEPAPSNTPTPTPLPTNTPVPPSPSPTPEPGTGKPFGPFNFPPDQSAQWPFTLTRLGRDLSQYEDAYQRGVKVLAAITGGHSSYTNANGCFDLQMYKDALDRQDLPAFQAYVDNETVVGLYAMDEPHDWGNDCGPTFHDLNEICKHAHLRLPGIQCGFNTPPEFLQPGAPYSDIDFLFTQTNFQRTSDWSAWATAQFQQAAWFDGPLYLSINAWTGSPTAVQIGDAAVALCESPAAGVMMWKWNQPDYNSLPGMPKEMKRAAKACAGSE